MDHTYAFSPQIYFFQNRAKLPVLKENNNKNKKKTFIKHPIIYYVLYAFYVFYFQVYSKKQTTSLFVRRCILKHPLK